jgi:thiamine biosynthesis lipoprotein
MKRAVAILLGIALMIGFLYQRGKKPELQQTQGHAMGCEWTLLYRNADQDPAELQREVQTILDHWEQVMSTWRVDSDLSRFNRGEPATADLQRVLTLADKMRIATDGTFDANVLEAVHRSGFGPEGKGVDLSGIGKGFAVDRVAERLRVLGASDFLFQLAGETIAGEEAWEVGIEAPDPTGLRVTKKVTLQNRALATSGNYRQFQNAERGIVSHIIDPRTGEPVIRAFSAVTVIAEECATADAWATALFVSGKREVLASLEVWWQE